MTNQKQPGSAPSIEERLARLEDVEAIGNLKIRYASLCDQSYDPDGIASLFTEDGIWQVDAFGVKNEGREAIRAYMKNASKRIPWALHYVMAPVIEVAPDRQSAVGTWYLLVLCSMSQPDDPEALDPVIMSGTYRDTFVKGTDGEWKFAHLRGYIHQVSSLDQGWVKQRFRGR